MCWLGVVFLKAVYSSCAHYRHQKLDHFSDGYFEVKQDFLFEALCYVANYGGHYLLPCFIDSD